MATDRTTCQHAKGGDRVRRSEESPVKRLLQYGQSPWLDFIQRGMLHSGELDNMIERWGIRGVTSNPSIFEKAICNSTDYDAQIDRLLADGHRAPEIYETLVLADVRSAADSLRGIFDTSDGRDGFVSLEVSPHLVRDTAGTIAEARRFWRLLDRPNVMIKVPATTEGLPAIRQLIAAGINVNITLLFSLARYAEVIDAYMGGLEDAIAAGRPVAGTSSVASFFLSRIDTLIDEQIDAVAAANPGRAEEAQRLKGSIAIASARCAYEMFQDAVGSERFLKLAARGGRMQRLLWASTGTKNPAYSDVKYVEPLIGPDTVSTLPLETLQAYDDHGSPAERLTANLEEARDALRALEGVGIDLHAATDQLLEAGIGKFIEPFEALHRALERPQSGPADRTID